ncbi:MAG TPA: FHA domain-containing protein [Planctomycetota bacterium]|nr:FHA domain-containing protein [Planctomycetota bacterium]
MSGDAPGGAYFLEFVARHRLLTRTRFLEVNALPVLLLTSAVDAEASDTRSTVGEARADAVQPVALPISIWAVEKRPGANTTPAVTIGRAPTNDVVIPDPGVSRMHAALLRKGDRWTIADASSTGTWVDGEKLQPRAPRYLGENAHLRLGPAVHLTFMGPEKLFELVARTLPH